MQHADYSPTTICAIATPSGSGALGIIRLSGPDACILLSHLCRRKRFLPYRLHYVTLWHPEHEEVLDHPLVCYMPAPRSYTGEEVCEIYAHGGECNLQRIIDNLIRLGARHAQPGEFTKRAFLNGRLDLAQAEAVGQIIAATNTQALRNAQAIYAGELGERLGAIEQQTIDLAAQLEACIDFSEDLELQPSLTALTQRCVEIEEEIAQLLATYEQGRLLGGAQVGIVGPVNVGKSSVFNMLLGRQRALVSAEPGTTRDYLEGEVFWQGHRIILVDTVGERPEAELTALERAGHQLAHPMLQQSDVLLSVIDLSIADPLSQVSELEQPFLVIANKEDLSTTAKKEAVIRALGPRAIFTTALAKQGKECVEEGILRLLFSSNEEGKEEVKLTQKRHWTVLKGAKQHMVEARLAVQKECAAELVVEHVRQSLQLMAEIRGHSYTEEILDHIFDTFCIGK